jgi:iron(III) transport system ATP-binding protein
MTSLEVSHLRVDFASNTVISDLSFSLEKGEIAALLGPSGCGKTTLLRAIAGLVAPAAGTVRLDNQLVGLSSVHLPPHKRSIGYVPQQGALFPHLSVAKNISFGLSKKVYSEVEIKRITDEMLELISMKGFEDAMPTELSGGQLTRVSLARALAIKPKMVLLDEPFSALDAQLRNVLREDVVSLLRSLKATAILVTHDREEALVSADKVLLMRGGDLAQFGSPEEVYEFPSTPQVAESTGDVLILPALSYGNNGYSYALSKVTPASDSLENGFVVIRPEEIKVVKSGAADTPFVTGVLCALDYYGHDAMLTISLDDSTQQIKSRVSAPLTLAIGDRVTLEHVGPIRFFSKP